MLYISLFHVQKFVVFNMNLKDLLRFVNFIVYVFGIGAFSVYGFCEYKNFYRYASMCN